MELIIGGCFQGKLEYARQRLREKGLSEQESSASVIEGEQLLNYLCKGCSVSGKKSGQKESRKKEMQDKTSPDLEEARLKPLCIINGLHRMLYLLLRQADDLLDSPDLMQDLNHSLAGDKEEIILNRSIALLERLLEQAPDSLIVCDEVGYGLIPIDPMERQYRELVGRSLCHLTGRAKRVVRIVGGLPMVLKEKE